MQIGAAVNEIHKFKGTRKTLNLEAINVRVNLYSMVYVNTSGNVKLVDKAESNDRIARQRPDLQDKSEQIKLFDNQIR